MKRVLRSCFEPLPRFMSTKSLVGLVIMLLAGTGISVYEYLESARPPERHPERVESAPSEDRGEVHAAEPGSAGQKEPRASSKATRPLPPCSSAVEYLRHEVGPAAGPAQDAPPSPPSVWDPSEPRIGN